MKRFAIFGANGFGREVLPLVRQQLQADWAAVFPDTEMPDKPRRFQKFARV
jgi:hypothetical protein